MKHRFTYWQTEAEFEAACVGVPGLDMARWRQDYARSDVATASTIDGSSSTTRILRRCIRSLFQPGRTAARSPLRMR